MSNDKMREEFERTNGRDHRRQPPKGNNYIDPMAQADWESFQKGWDQSREALVIELPAEDPRGTGPGDCGDGRPSFEQHCAAECNFILRDCREAIEAAGVKVKP